MPGFVFQGIIIAGGYGTGRELVEYFMKYGPVGGILGMFAVTMVIWSIILAVTFEFSRKFRAYDYRTLLLRLLGPFWVVFEILYIVLLLIVLAVVGSAAGVLLRDYFGIPYMMGVMIMLVAIGILTFKGSSLIEKFLSSWSMLIYVVYGLFLVAALIKFGPLIQKNLASAVILPRWALGGFKYAIYNMGVIPAVLFCVRHAESRKESLLAGLIAGIIGILPAFLFYMAVLGHYPEVISEEIPAVFVLQRAEIPLLLVIFIVVLFGTLIETGTGFIHAVNQRIQSTLQARGKEFPNWQRPLVAAGLLLTSLGISSFGIIDLIAKGYGSISWGFFLVFIIPLLTVGLYKIFKLP